MISLLPLVCAPRVRVGVHRQKSTENIRPVDGNNPHEVLRHKSGVYEGPPILVRHVSTKRRFFGYKLQERHQPIVFILSINSICRLQCGIASSIRNNRHLFGTRGIRLMTRAKPLVIHTSIYLSSDD